MKKTNLNPIISVVAMLLIGFCALSCNNEQVADSKWVTYHNDKVDTRIIVCKCDTTKVAAPLIEVTGRVITHGSYFAYIQRELVNHVPIKNQFILVDDNFSTLCRDFEMAKDEGKLLGDVYNYVNKVYAFHLLDCIRVKNIHVSVDVER